MDPTVSATVTPHPDATPEPPPVERQPAFSEELPEFPPFLMPTPDRSRELHILLTAMGAAFFVGALSSGLITWSFSRRSVA